MKTIHVVNPARIGNDFYYGRDAVIKQMVNESSGVNIIYRKRRMLLYMGQLYPNEYDIVDYTGDWHIIVDSDGLDDD